MLKRLWKCEGGAIISAELVLVMTILVIGCIVGLTCVRNAVVGELSTVGEAIGSLNQSYAFPGVTSGEGNGCCERAYTAGSAYRDDPREDQEGLGIRFICPEEPVNGDQQVLQLLQ